MLTTEILAALDELIDVNENYTLSRDDRTRALRDRVAGEPVYVKVDRWEWCHRHQGPIMQGQMRCIQWTFEEVGWDVGDRDPGRCGRSPLYVEALDP
jgi:hypothetical protein